jgi:hypothetical protein
MVIWHIFFFKNEGFLDLPNRGLRGERGDGWKWALGGRSWLGVCDFYFLGALMTGVAPLGANFSKTASKASFLLSRNI